MKKNVRLLPVAAVLGILITLVPLLTITQTESAGTSNQAYAPSLAPALKRLNGQNGTNSNADNESSLTVLAVGLIIALAAYTVVRRRIPRQYDTQFRIPA
jgi:hypothetical protein